MRTDEFLLPVQEQMALVEASIDVAEQVSVELGAAQHRLTGGRGAGIRDLRAAEKVIMLEEPAPGRNPSIIMLEEPPLGPSQPGGKSSSP